MDQTEQLQYTYNQYAKIALSLLDLTSLSYEDTPLKISQLCQKGITEFGNVAAICIFSQFIPHAKQTIANATANNAHRKYHGNHEHIKLATVVNFPHGSNDIELTLFETSLAIKRGADEIDVVFPYHAFLAQDIATCTQFIKQVRQICQKNILKVILETGVLQQTELIKLASNICIENGADFIKTSTGTIKEGATVKDALTILTEIKNSKSNCGLKVSGGIRDLKEAITYIDLVINVMGKNWLNKNKFRIGASSLLDDIIKEL